MSLETRVRHVDGVVVIDLNGGLLFGIDGEMLRETLIGVFETGHPRILLNLAGLHHADSGGLGDLVAAYSAISRRGGALKLLNPQKKIASMLKLTHIDSLFEIFHDEQTALSAFIPGEARPQTSTLSDFLNE